MSSLTVDFIISLDGYGAADGWPGYWGMEGPEYLAHLEQEGAEDHTVLLGATTYRLMSGFAAAMPDDPGLAGLTAMPKVVFSSTLEEPLSWSNAELAGGDPVETVRDLKRRDARPLRTVGSLTLCRSLLAAPAWSTGSVSSSSRHHRRDGEGAHLRRVSRHRPRPGRAPHLRRTPPAARSTSPRCWTRTARRRRPGLSPVPVIR